MPTHVIHSHGQLARAKGKIRWRGRFISLGFSNAEWDFLTMLKVEGRRSAESFLAAHGGNVGKHSTLNLEVLLEQV